MSVRCANCGEELLGAVNRCWKCGRQFVARPTAQGLPPVQAELAAAAAEPAIEAQVLDEEPDPAAPTVPVSAMPAPFPAPAAMLQASAPPLPANPLATPSPPALARPAKTIPNYAALGGTIAALLLGTFSLLLAAFRFEAAIVALVGLVMGIWGLYSPRRGWALVGMLLCCLGISIGTFTGVRQLYWHLNRNAPVVAEDS
jgi:hypothetical protein